MPDKVTFTHPKIIAAVIDRLKADDALKALVGDRVFDADPTSLPAGPYIVVTAGQSTPSKLPNTLTQALVDVKSVAATESLDGVVLVAVQACLNGRKFGIVKTSILHDTAKPKVTAEGWHYRIDEFAAFHTQDDVADPLPLTPPPSPEVPPPLPLVA